MSFDQAEFLKLYNQIAERFPAMKPLVVTAAVVRILEDLPMKAVREICIDFFENAKHTPLPGDFRKAASAWRKNNNFYSHIQEAEVINCSTCGDLGIIRIRHHERSDFDQLMRCSCENQLAGEFRAPTWGNSLLGAFKKEKCPVEWFKPSGPVDIAAFLSDRSILVIMENWKKKKIRSEEYWRAQGF